MATKYQPLIDHLATVSEGEIVISLAEIEAILGFPLAVSMQIEAAYWRSPLNPHVREMKARGWRARLDHRNRCVIFTREE